MHLTIFTINLLISEFDKGQIQIKTDSEFFLLIIYHVVDFGCVIFGYTKMTS